MAHHSAETMAGPSVRPWRSAAPSAKTIERQDGTERDPTLAVDKQRRIDMA
jgi:hypothetical protein